MRLIRHSICSMLNRSQRILGFALLTAVLVLCGLGVLPVKSQSSPVGFIFIKPDGVVEPPSAPVQRAGDIYTFTGNIHDAIVIERNHIILDGAGLSLDGVGHNGTIMDRDTRVGINITASNVTITNIRVFRWNAGILGAYNGNSIIGNWITNCSYGIKVYSNNCTIAKNYIANNSAGIQLNANRTVISRNNLTDNGNGIVVGGWDNLIVENNFSSRCDFSGLGIGSVIYRNNFFRTDARCYVYVWSDQDASWGNGREGNYWGGYEGRDANGDGIGDEPYNFGRAETYKDEQGRYNFTSHLFAVDIYPLIKPVANYDPPEPSPTPMPTFSVTPAPTDTPPLSIHTSTPTLNASATPLQPPPPSEQPENMFSADIALPIVVIAAAVSTAAVFVVVKRRLHG